MAQTFSQTRRASLALALFGTTAWAVPALAQSEAKPQPVAAPAPAPVNQGGLQDIVVTARKRAENVQSVPVAITAVSAQQIQRQDLTSLEKIAARTPNFTVGHSSNGSGAQLTMRGIGSSSTSIGIEQSVAVVVDGVYYGQGRTVEEGFFDLARLEILKGPQALFFGKNATAGVISVTTADPTSKPELTARGSYEFRGHALQGELIGSTPITDTLGIRVAIRANKMFDGYYRNIAAASTYNTFDVATGALNTHVTPPAARDEPEERELLGRITLKWTPSPAFTDTLKLSGDANDQNNGSYNYVAYKCPTGSSALNPVYGCGYSFTVHQNNLAPELAKNMVNAKSDGKLFNRYRSGAVTNTANYKLDDITITDIINFNANKNRFLCACDYQSSPTPTFATEGTTYRSFSNELRAATSFDGPLNLLVGMLYQKTRRNYRQDVMFANLEDSSTDPSNRYLALYKISHTAGETIAGFGQVTWKIIPTVEASAGVRYTHETKDSFFTQPYVNAALRSLFRTTDSPDGLGIANAHQVFNNWSPEATLTWKPTSDIMVYGGYKTAYKSGGFSNGGLNSAASSDPTGDLTFRPERASGFEGGVKTTLFDRQLRFNLAAYTYAYKDLQVDFFNSVLFAFQTLTANARTKGVELEFEYAPRQVQGLNLHGSVNLNRARYTSFPLASCYAGETPAEGCSLAFNITTAAFTRQNLNGAPLAVAPKWTGTLGASYDADVSSSMRFGISFDARYSGSYLATAFGNEDTRQKDYVNLDASIRLASADDRWELALIGKNLTNRLYVTGGIDGPSTGTGTGTPAGIHADQYGFGVLPRTVQLQATFHY